MRPADAKLFAHAIDVEPQFALSEPLAHRTFLGKARIALLGDRFGVDARHEYNAVVVGHDDVAGVHADAGDDNRHIDRAERRLDGALCAHAATPDREVQFLESARRHGSRRR